MQCDKSSRMFWKHTEGFLKQTACIRKAFSAGVSFELSSEGRASDLASSVLQEQPRKLKHHL